jgi:FixJ family two-component response regulator
MKRVIAIVDDDESGREGLANLMAALGYEAEAYSSAEEFMKSARRDRVGCLISDVNMPGMSGPELHRKLAGLGESIPTIFVTAYPDEEVRRRALAGGVSCYLKKPVVEEDLLACVRSALDHPSSQNAL